MTDTTRAIAVAALERYRGAKGRMEYLGVNQDGNQCHRWHVDEAHDALVDAALADLNDLAVAGGQAAQWTPLPDGEYGNVEVEGYILATWFCDNKIKEFLPDDIRLCRLVPAPVVQGGGA